MIFKLTKIFFILAILLLITACVPTQQLNTPFQLHIDEQAKVEEIQITLVSVLEDSRCPQGVLCIWEGAVKVIVNVQKGKENLGDVTLVSSKTIQYDEEATVLGYTIRLVDVQPPAQESIKIPPEEYVTTFIITKQ